MASLDWVAMRRRGECPRKDERSVGLKGTRMPVSAIFENIQAGTNIDDIMQWFDGLDREQVEAVIAFAARSLENPPACAA